MRSRTRAIRVRLPDPDLACLRPTYSHPDLVILNLAPLRIAQEPGMNNPQMSNVQQIFNQPRPKRPKPVRARQQNAKSRLLRHRKLGQRARILA